jgi:hypothetical protein
MFKPSFIDAYKRSRSKLPIQVWYQVAGRHLPQFQTDEDVYAPVPINVKLSGGINDPDGTVRLSVCPTNKNWYLDLTSALTEMTGKKNLDVVNMEGKCISGFDTKSLFAVGECDIVDKGSKKLVRLESVVEPPLRMSTNKSETLKKWWEEQSESISREVAQVLRGKNMTEIASAMTKSGAVYETIQSKLEESAPEDFLKIYGSGLVRTSPQDLSDKLLHAVRRSLVANEQQIRHFTNAPEQQSLWKQRETTQIIQTPYKDDFTMYRGIVDDAIFHPAVCRDVIHSVLYGTKKIQAPVTTKKEKEKEFSEYHPLESFYKVHYYNTYGKLPGHVINAYNKTIGTNMQQQKMFPGNAEEAFNVFHMLSGRAYDLIEGHDKKKKKGGEYISVGKKKRSKVKSYRKRGDPSFWHFKKNARLHDARQREAETDGNWLAVRQRKAAEQKYMKSNNLIHVSDLDEETTIESDINLPRLVPINDELPRLVPIDQEIGEEQELVEGLGDFFRKRRTRKQGEKELSEVEREQEALNRRREEASRKANLRNHIGSELPRLVPIDKPRLVPIPRDEILNANLWDQQEEEELPSISQLLSRNY